MLFEVNPLSEYAPEADADIAVASLVLSVETELHDAMRKTNMVNSIL